MEEDFEDLDDDDFNFIEETVPKPPPAKKRRGRPKKQKDILSSDEEYEPVLKHEMLFEEEALMSDEVFDFYDELQMPSDKSEKEQRKSDRETRKNRTKRIQENKGIRSKVDESNIVFKDLTCHICTENVKGESIS